MNSPTVDIKGISHIYKPTSSTHTQRLCDSIWEMNFSHGPHVPHSPVRMWRRRRHRLFDIQRATRQSLTHISHMSCVCGFRHSLWYPKHKVAGSAPCWSLQGFRTGTIACLCLHVWVWCGFVRESEEWAWDVVVGSVFDGRLHSTKEGYSRKRLCCSSLCAKVKPSRPVSVRVLLEISKWRRPIGWSVCALSIYIYIYAWLPRPALWNAPSGMLFVHTLMPNPLWDMVSKWLNHFGSGMCVRVFVWIRKRPMLPNQARRGTGIGTSSME